MTEREEYEQLVASHDWDFEFSDDHGKWQRGNAAFRRIRELRPKVDPDYRLWNQHAPISMRHPPIEWVPGEPT